MLYPALFLYPAQLPMNILNSGIVGVSLSKTPFEYPAQKPINMLFEASLKCPDDLPINIL